MTTHSPEVDELRTKLRALGYLDAGVDRFVLGPIQPGRGLAGLAFRLSTRIGVLAALLLGPAVAVGVESRLPGLITGPRDAFVVAAYLGALLGAGATLASFVTAIVAALLMSRYATRDRTAARTKQLATLAGAVVTVACLAYLTLWWRTADPAGSGGELWWTALALVVAVAISLLLGRAVRTTATAVIAANARSAELPAQRSQSWTVSLGSGAIAFLGAAVLLLATAPRDGASARRAPAETLAVVPTGLRVRVIGIDGFDPALFRRLADRGDIPQLARLANGAVARLRVEPDRDPARVWTSLATGLPAAQHGIESIETRRVAGVQGAVATSRSPLVRAVSATTDLLRLSRPAVASGLERREKTFWEIASDAGLRTVVVNWWATWPAATDGIVISDRAVLRLERGGVLDAEIAPAPVYKALLRVWPGVRRLAQDRAQHAFVGESQDILATLRRSAELDALQLELARHESVGRPDLLSVYLPGLDIAQYALLASAEATGLAPSALSERVEALAQYYAYLDQLLAPVLAAEPGALAIVLTHPGRLSVGTEALLALTGGVAQPGVSLAAHLADIAPTVLYSLGVPISRELPGQPLLQLFEGSFVRRYPVRHVATYGTRTQPGAPRAGTGLDAEAIERLRSLGYVR